MKEHSGSGTLGGAANTAWAHRAREDRERHVEEHSAGGGSADVARAWPAQLGSIELVWHRANTRSELMAFIASDVEWVECDVRSDADGVLRVHHEPLDGDGRAALRLSEWLEIVGSSRRRAKIDLKEGGTVPQQALREIGLFGFADDALWFNAAVEIPGGEAGFGAMSGAHPGARVSCPLDTLAPYLLVAPEPSFPILEVLRSWGVNWLCIGACVPGAQYLVPMLQHRRWPINIWDVETAGDLDLARSMGPRSITADLAEIPTDPAQLRSTAPGE
jgi:hypothetical protein